MKKIGHFLKSKSLQKKIPLDEKSVFYIFSKVIRNEYGNRGVENIKIGHFKGQKLFIRVENSNWKSEVSFNRNSIMEKLNRELGGQEIEDVLVD